MYLIRGIKNIDLYQAKFSDISTVATIGNFDGLHLGHQQIIQTMQREAEDLGLKKLKSAETAMTFVREYLKNTFTPWFGEDSKLLTQLIEDNVSFKKFTVVFVPHICEMYGRRKIYKLRNLELNL